MTRGKHRVATSTTNSPRGFPCGSEPSIFTFQLYVTLSDEPGHLAIASKRLTDKSLISVLGAYSFHFGDHSESKSP